MIHADYGYTKKEIGMNLLKGYSKKWALPDVIIILDILQNAIGTPQYEAIGRMLGIDENLINIVTSIMELVRFSVLAYSGQSTKNK
jgi:hypothetical protein